MTVVSDTFSEFGFLQEYIIGVSILNRVSVNVTQSNGIVMGVLMACINLGIDLV